MRSRATRLKHASAIMLFAAFATAPALAQEQAPPPASAPSESAMSNLVRLLVEQGVVSKDKGEALMAQAEAEAVKARVASTQQTQAGLPPAAAGTIRVPYVPETVRAQIKEELKSEVLAQAKAEGWAAPEQAAPDWTRRIRLSGDLRFRSQSTLFSSQNSNLIPDYARINAIGPLGILDSNTFIPFLNSTRDRTNRLQVRARIGLNATITEDIDVGFQLASGDDNSPISTNQSLGGGFAKRDIWLQNAFLKLRPTQWSEIALGRFANPFFHTDLLFDEDLAFDGAALSLDSKDMISDDFRLAARGGAFPLDFGDPNFPQNDVEKRSYPSRWLFSGQLELAADLGNDVRLKVAGAYHYFSKLQAHLSEPCYLYRVQAEFRNGVVCSTDNERATFLRKGNTVVPIRDVVLDDPAPAPNETRVSPQFVGLAFNYHVLDINGQVSFPVSDSLGVTVNGNYLRNLAFKRGDLCRFGSLSISYPPLNNVGASGNGNVCDTNAATRSDYVGGNEGYLAKLTFGSKELARLGQWQAEVGYRYLESDAVPDSFTDSDFHLGGTNAKGYFIGAKAALWGGMTLGARWLSANEIAAEPFAIDVLQIDLEARF